MSVVIFIPARYASTRYPGKPLVELAGVSGERKTLIQRAWEAAKTVPGVDSIYVLTDDTRIADVATHFGAEIIMTSAEARNGTERCSEGLSQLAYEPRTVINLQGDAPLTPHWFVEALLAVMADGAQMATPVLRCDSDMLSNFLADRKEGRVGGTTVVMKNDQSALYFSKEVLPYIAELQSPPQVWHHVGVYAYTPDALRAYKNWEEGPLERAEGLEQLRFLENGVQITCVPVEANNRVFWELNNPIDVSRIEKILKEEGII